MSWDWKSGIPADTLAPGDATASAQTGPRSAKRLTDTELPGHHAVGGASSLGDLHPKDALRARTRAHGSLHVRVQASKPPGVDLQVRHAALLGDSASKPMRFSWKSSKSVRASVK